jgi:hypothetical protein
MLKTPECDKMHAAHEQSQAIGEFLDTAGHVLAEWVHIDWDASVEGEVIPKCEPGSD